MSASVVQGGHKKQFCMPLGQLSHLTNVSSMISYRQTYYKLISEQSDTAAHYTMDIGLVDISYT